MVRSIDPTLPINDIRTGTKLIEHDRGESECQESENTEQSDPDFCASRDNLTAGIALCVE